MKNTVNSLFWFLLAAVVFTFAGCAHHEKTKKEILAPLKKVMLTKNLTIPSKVDTLIVGSYGKISTDDQQNIFAVDYQRDNRILEFNKQGHFIRQIGRKGAGPGEFRRISALVILKDTLYVKDNALRRIDLFHLPQASFIRSVLFPIHIKGFKVPGDPMGFVVLDNGSIGVHYENPMAKYKSASKDFFYWLLAPKNIPRIPIPVFRGYKFYERKGGKFIAFVVDPTGSHAILKSYGNRFYLGLTDSLKITAYQPDGSPVITYKLNIPPAKVTSALRDTILKHQRWLSSHASELGSVFPVYQNFWIDDSGRVWVQLYNPGHKHHYLIVFKANGKPAWKTMVPNQLEINCIRNHSLYGIWQGKDGMTSIVRYSVSFS